MPSGLFNGVDGHHIYYMLTVLAPPSVRSQVRIQRLKSGSVLSTTIQQVHALQHLLVRDLEKITVVS